MFCWACVFTAFGLVASTHAWAQDGPTTLVADSAPDTHAPAPELVDLFVERCATATDARNLIAVVRKVNRLLRDYEREGGALVRDRYFPTQPITVTAHSSAMTRWLADEQAFVELVSLPVRGAQVSRVGEQVVLRAEFPWCRRDEAEYYDPRQRVQLTKHRRAITDLKKDIRKLKRQMAIADQQRSGPDDDELARVLEELLREALGEKAAEASLAEALRARQQELKAAQAAIIELREAVQQRKNHLETVHVTAYLLPGAGGELREHDLAAARRIVLRGWWSRPWLGVRF